MDLTNNMNGLKTIFSWLLALLLAAAFLAAGGMKLAGVERMVVLFGEIGAGQWFRYFTGAVEIAAALLLLFPRTSVQGAALIVCTMIGAIFTHLFLIGGSFMPALILGILAVCIMALRLAGRRR